MRKMLNSYIGVFTVLKKYFLDYQIRNVSSSDCTFSPSSAGEKFSQKGTGTSVDVNLPLMHASKVHISLNLYFNV